MPINSQQSFSIRYIVLLQTAKHVQVGIHIGDESVLGAVAKMHGQLVEVWKDAPKEMTQLFTRQIAID